MRQSLFHKLRLVINIIRLYKTWHLAILDRYGLLSGMIKHTLRNNAQYRVRARADDTSKINAIYIGKEYDELIDNIRNDSVVIDIGAHVGIFSIYAEMLVENVTVYSYEPSTENYALLKTNIRLNNADEKIHAFNLAVSGKSGVRRLYINKTNPGASSIFYKANDSIEIDAISLKDIFNKNNLTHCDFLKMDCEGAECEILFDTPKEYLHRIKTISMEYHDNINLNELIKFLKDNGFEVKLKKDKPYLLYAQQAET